MKWLSVRKPMTISDVESVERALNVCLPQDYKKLIGPINGGALKNAYVTIAGVGDVPYSRNISLYKGAPANIYDLINTVNGGIIKLFPFSNVGNGDFFCFDLEKNKVVLFMHETGVIVDVCNSFTQLLERLKQNND